MQMIRYFGWYSNRMRGDRARAGRAAAADCPEEVVIDDEDTPYRKLCRMHWAALIKRVYEVDPLCCPKCGHEMKVIAFIEKRDQPDVVEKILSHCGLWERPTSRAPPRQPAPRQLDLEYVDTDEFLMAL